MIWKEEVNLKFQRKEIIIAHGDAYSIVFKDSLGNESNIATEKFVEILKMDPNYHGGNIRLISCQTGAGGGIVPQYIADALKINVLAPTEIVNVDFDVNMILSDNEECATMGIETGRWILFKPSRR